MQDRPDAKEISMKRVLVAALAFSTLLGSVAMADSDDRGRGHHERRDSDRRHNHRDDDRDDHRRDYRGERHDDRRWDNRHWDDRRHYDRSDRYRHDHYRYDRYRAARYYRPHGYRPYAWYSGARLPAAYYAPRYVVHDYGAYRLRHPPRGYHWVRVDNDVLLAAIATGVVVQVVNGLFYY